MSHHDRWIGRQAARESRRALQLASRRAARGWRLGCEMMEALEPRVLLSRVLFDAAALYGTGMNLSSTVAADFNGDGKPDLAVADADGVSVLLNNGDGTFAAKVDYATGDWPSSVTAADFNGDGKIDLAVANANDNTVSILLNNGHGTFVADGDYATGTDPWSVTAADFNGDGMADLAVANANDNTVSLLLNNGNGTFAAKVDYATGANPISVVAADFNGDGIADLAVASGGGVSVLLNNGDGTLGTKVGYATGTNPQSVVAADFNGDGKADLAVANLDANKVSVLLNNGSGSFAAKVDYTTGTWPIAVTAADINGDGKADLVVANYYSSTVSVLLNRGTGTFAAKVDYATGSHPAAVIAADFNMDGQADLAVANQADGTMSVLLNHGNGTFATKTSYATGADPVAVTTADFNNDGYPDLAVANRLDNTVSVLLNNGDGTFATKVNYSTGLDPVALTVADFNRDGYPDLAVVNARDNTVSILLNDGDGTFTAGGTFATGLWPDSVTAADFNNDGFPDLAVANLGDDMNPGDTVSVLLNNGDGTFAAKTDYTTGSSPSSVAAADFNGDGFMDFVAASGDGVSVLLNDGSGSFTPKVDYATGSSSESSPTAVTVADFNGDGSPDLAVLNWDPGSDTATVSVLRNIGDGSFAPKVDYAVGNQEGFAMTAADFNGDGAPDLAVAIQYSDIVSVLANKGDGQFAAKFDYTGGYAPVAMTAADFNGDGFVDLALANERNSTVSVLRSQNPVSVKLVWQQEPSNGIAGQTLAPLVVNIEDADGNLVANDNSYVTVAIAGGPGGGLFGTATVGAVDGVATFSDLWLTMAGTYTLTASNNFLSAGLSDAFTISPDAASQVAFMQEPVGGQVGPLGIVTVAVEDQFGNLVATDHSTVNVTLPPGGGTLLGATSVNAVNGLATFSDLALYTSGAFFLNAGDATLTAATSGNFTLTAAPATHLAFHQQPATGGIGAPITFVVWAEDDYGNLDATDHSTVVVNVNTIPSTPSSGVLVGATDHGAATFDFLSIAKAGTYTLVASDGNLLGATSNNFLVGAKLVISQQPASATAGVTINPGFTVLIEDAGGRVLTTENSAVTLAFGLHPAGAVLLGTTTVNAVNGVATFSNLSLQKTGTYTLVAADGSIAPGTSKNFTITAATASHMVCQQTGALSYVAGAKMTLPLSFVLLDPFENVAANYNGTVTLSLVTGPGTLTGTMSMAAKNGIAAFSNLTLQKAGAYTLHAAAGSFGADSPSFTVTPGAAKKLVFELLPATALVGMGITPAIKADVVDAFGNLVTNSTVSVTLALASSPKGGTFTSGSSGGTFTSLTVAAVNGVAAFNGVALSKAGIYKLKATAMGLTLVTSGSLTVS